MQDARRFCNTIIECLREMKLMAEKTISWLGFILLNFCTYSSHLNKNACYVQNNVSLKCRYVCDSVSHSSLQKFGPPRRHAARITKFGHQAASLWGGHTHFMNCTNVYLESLRILTGLYNVYMYCAIFNANNITMFKINNSSLTCNKSSAYRKFAENNWKRTILLQNKKLRFVGNIINSLCFSRFCTVCIQKFRDNSNNQNWSVPFQPSHSKLNRKIVILYISRLR